jgi:hypothetical protein
MESQATGSTSSADSDPEYCSSSVARYEVAAPYFRRLRKAVSRRSREHHAVATGEVLAVSFLSPRFTLRWTSKGGYATSNAISHEGPAPAASVAAHQPRESSLRPAATNKPTRPERPTQ